MKMNIKQTFEKVLGYIRDNIDAQATVSRSTGAAVIHYAVANGQVHVNRKGEESDFKSFKQLNAIQAIQFCDDMEWTHNNQVK